MNDMALRELISSKSDRFYHWRPQIESALKRVSHSTFEDIVDGLLKVELLWFEVPDAFVVVQVVEHPQERELHILLGGGSQAGLEELEEQVSRFGREIGAAKLTMLCRRGFWRRIKSQGWKSPLQWIEKEL
jgi:hypothetical protein